MISGSTAASPRVKLVSERASNLVTSSLSGLFLALTSNLGSILAVTTNFCDRGFDKGSCPTLFVVGGNDGCSCNCPGSIAIEDARPAVKVMGRGELRAAVVDAGTGAGMTAASTCISGGDNRSCSCPGSVAIDDARAEEKVIGGAELRAAVVAAGTAAGMTAASTCIEVPQDRLHSSYQHQHM